MCAAEAAPGALATDEGEGTKEVHSLHMFVRAGKNGNRRTPARPMD